jgi:hypothetical protein
MGYCKGDAGVFVIGREGSDCSALEANGEGGKFTLYGVVGVFGTEIVVCNCPSSPISWSFPTRGK